MSLGKVFQDGTRGKEAASSDSHNCTCSGSRRECEQKQQRNTNLR